MFPHLPTTPWCAVGRFGEGARTGRGRFSGGPPAPRRRAIHDGRSSIPGRSRRADGGGSRKWRRPFQDYTARDRKRAKDAVWPWMKFWPETGPSSPAAKKPAMGVLGRARLAAWTSWEGVGKRRVPRPLQEKRSAP